jgi:hypothetical protein
LLRGREYIFLGKANHFFVAFFEHTGAIEVELKSGEVRENRVRKPDCWDSVELQTRRMLIRYTGYETMELGLTNGSPFKYQLMKRVITIKDPARNDTLRVISSATAMLQRS